LFHNFSVLPVDEEFSDCSVSSKLLQRNNASGSESCFRCREEALEGEDKRVPVGRSTGIGT
jgi:hypothetical protein